MSNFNVDNINSKLNNFGLGYGEAVTWEGNASSRFSSELQTLKDARSYQSKSSIVAIGYALNNLEEAKKCYDEFNKVYQTYLQYKEEKSMAMQRYRQACNDPDCSRYNREYYKSSYNTAQLKVQRAAEALIDVKKRLRTHLNNIR